MIIDKELFQVVSKIPKIKTSIDAVNNGVTNKMTIDVAIVDA